ncbi:helix-turn-helix domain-containing protein [Corynebacterium amycolatum]|uniref:helix-turn-helix domain-containing protein n=1 Tax=Corynebacterium amycolatum TaxID=43765 RepID=UPI0031651685
MNKLNPWDEHQAAEKELWRLRGVKSKYADSLYRRNDQNPGSVPQREWNRLKKLQRQCDEQQDLVHRLAPEALAYNYEQYQAERQARRERVVQLFNEGKTAKEIAAELGISTTTVYKDRKEAQQPSPERSTQQTTNRAATPKLNTSSTPKPKPPTRPTNKPPTRAAATPSRKPTPKQQPTTNNELSTGWFIVAVIVLLLILFAVF